MVTVVMPARNEERWLERSLDSVLAQTYSAFEIVVVDNGSTDRTAEIAERMAQRDARVRVMYAPAGCGVPHARNVGLEAATTELVTCLDADDAWHPEHLAAQMTLMHGAPDDVVGVWSSGVI